MSHNVSRWLARLDAGSTRFAQRSSWLLRDQSSSDEEEADIHINFITDGISEEEVDKNNCNAEKVKVENKIQEIEDLVTVRLYLLFCFA